MQMTKMLFSPKEFNERMSCFGTARKRSNISREDWAYIHAKAELLGYEMGDIVLHDIDSLVRKRTMLPGIDPLAGKRNPEVEETYEIAKNQILKKEGLIIPHGITEAWKLAVEADDVLTLLLWDRKTNESSYFCRHVMGLDIFKIIVKMAGLFFLNPK
jgi:hypothetical protein